MNFRPLKPVSEKRVSYVKTIKRNNKILNAAALPKVACYNMRSLIPKIEMLSTDLKDRMCSLALLTEVWENENNKKHQNKIEAMFELKGLDYVSTPRPGNKRGGGAAVIVETEKYSISKLNVQNPDKLEIIWGLLKPTIITGKTSKIIICCFYCPPKSKKKSKLIEHMTITLHSLKTTYPNAPIIISGDRNDLSIERLLSIDPSLKQMVSKPTRGQNCSLFITDNQSYFETPIVPPIDVDDPRKGGVPSDHMGVVVTPIYNDGLKINRQRVTRTVRPITDSAIKNIGQVFCTEEWKFMNPELDSTKLTELFEFYTGGIIDTFCPLKTISERPGENPFMREDMKILKRKIMREYEKRGKSPAYFEMKKSLEEKIKSEKIKYKDKILSEVNSGTRNSAYAALKKLGARPGDYKAGLFTLPEHTDLGLSAVESAERIADHFAAISNTYEPINIKKLFAQTAKFTEFN